MSNQNPLRCLGRDLAGFCLLTTGALCIGLVVNSFRDNRLPLIYATKQQRLEEAVSHVTITAPASDPAPSQAVPPTTDNPHIIKLEEFRGIVEGRKSVILDARPEIFHRFGHVPGAISLPREDFESGYSKYKSLLESNKNQAIAVYCSGANCEDSGMVADALVKLGYAHILVFKGGWDEWSGAGLPQEGKQ